MNAHGAFGHAHPFQPFVPMKRILTGLAFMFLFISLGFAQDRCYTNNYLQQRLNTDPGLASQMEAIDRFVDTRLAEKSTTANRGEGKILVTVPVVFHVLYHESTENISEQKLIQQIQVLNEAFRRLAADTVITPDRFKSVAADCEIEFQLAIADPQRRSSSGIVRYYTPISYWDADDKMKLASNMGADAWDASQYLNIWVCNLRRGLGYASFPGGDPALDGLVLNYGIVGANNNSSYNQGKVAVHEAGHWLGLRHIWGDEYCGDDGVDDTPRQGGMTAGCPTGVRNSCGNGAAGDMYMNYMDLTSDACTNMFTIGQKERMQALFAAGGVRSGLLKSVGLLPPLGDEIPVQPEPPRWLHSNLYPNPTRTRFTLDVAYDPRWVGNTVLITNMQGRTVRQTRLNNSIQSFDVTGLAPGLYLLTCRRSDGKMLRHKLMIQ